MRAINLLLGTTRRSYMRMAIEDLADGKALKEQEHVFYAKLVDQDQLKNAASMEHQEQWNIKVEETEDNAGSGDIRVRKTEIPGGEPSYVLTTKIRTKEDGVKYELSIPATEELFTMFRFLAEKGMVKDRYRFPVVGTELVWEVDMYPKPDGGYWAWCRVELEVADLDAPIPSLPVNFKEVIPPKGYGRQDDPKIEELIDELFDECFLKENEFVEGTVGPNDPDNLSITEAPAPAANPEDGTIGSNGGDGAPEATP